MPTNPTQPNTNSSVDRLALGVDSPRGSEPSFPIPAGPMCFEAEQSGVFNSAYATCFETE